ncbi:MAG: long-chain fatty acid--CoA ligase [Oligoflexales bacterium]
MSETVNSVFQKTVSKYPNYIAYSFKNNGEWESRTWSEYWDEVQAVAASLLEHGLEPSDATTILSLNRPEWIIADLASIMAGGVPAGIYPTSSASQCEYILNHCKAKFIFLEDQSQLDKILGIKDLLTELKGIVLFDGTSDDPMVHTWSDFLEKGRNLNKKKLEERIANQTAEDLATLVYTSGTTANPKAVMLSHINLCWTAANVIQNHLKLSSTDVFISYLPLSHIAEQMVTIHGPLVVACQVSFAESIEKLPDNLKEVRPTVFLGVPRVWEKIQAKMVEKGAEASPLKKKIATWAKNVGLEQAKGSQYQQVPGLQYKIAKKIVYKKVREALGLDRCRFQITAAAPISQETLNFFFSLDIPIYEIYGMSECSGPATISLPDGKFRIGKAGLPIQDTEIKIAEDKEILVRGKHIFMGYLNNSEATKETLDGEGWLHSGDLGSIDHEGFLTINGRKKNLIITAGGENISTEMIESRFVSIPLVEHAVVIGDRKKYLSMLVTLDRATASSFSVEIGSQAKDPVQIAQCPLFNEYLKKEFDRINAGFARVQTVKQFKILDTNFSEASGELTPTMKVKRNVVLKKYENVIEELY